MLTLLPELKDVLNLQMNLERLNAAYYDALATQMEVINFEGTAKFFRESAQEEMVHYKKFSDYLIDRNETPSLTALPAPVLGQPTLLNAFQGAQAREAITTESIDALYDRAEEAGDNATCAFLLWFIDEQVRSERELFDYVVMIKRVGTGLGEQWFDHEIGEAK